MRIHLVVVCLLTLALSGCQGVRWRTGETDIAVLSGWNPSVLVTEESLPVVTEGPLIAWRPSIDPMSVSRAVTRSLVMRCNDASAVEAAKQTFSLYGRRRGWIFIALIARNPLTESFPPWPRMGIGDCKLLTYTQFQADFGNGFDPSLFVRLPDPPTGFKRMIRRHQNTSGTGPSDFMSDGAIRG